MYNYPTLILESDTNKVEISLKDIKDKQGIIKYKCEINKLSKNLRCKLYNRTIHKSNSFSIYQKENKFILLVFIECKDKYSITMYMDLLHRHKINVRYIDNEKDVDLLNLCMTYKIMDKYTEYMELGKSTIFYLEELGGHKNFIKIERHF